MITDIEDKTENMQYELEYQTIDSLNKEIDNSIIEAVDDFHIDDEDLFAAIEAILFACGDPIGCEKIALILGRDKITTEKLLNNMINEYISSPRRGIILRKINELYSFSTKPSLKNVLERLYVPRNKPQMSQAAYETLAIIAYNQPVTRSQVETVRGVSSDSIISRLAEKNLIRECGYLDAPGRPILFETTENFLKEFGLSSVSDLPPMDMIMYKTLREIEESVVAHQVKKEDSQITIDQIVMQNDTVQD